MSRRLRLLLVVALLSWQPAGATPAASAPPVRSDSVLPGPALLADIAVLEQAYAALHPGLYRYSSEQAVAQRFAALRAELGQGATLAQAYLAISRLTASVRCGHSFPISLINPRRSSTRCSTTTAICRSTSAGWTGAW